MKSEVVSIIVPVYNSCLILDELVRRLTETMLRLGVGYEIILVNDFSTDTSWQIITRIGKKDKRIKGVCLKKNVGQWQAILIGLSLSKGEFLVTIDDDLEYFPEDIAFLYDSILSGNHRIVLGIAKDKYIKQGKNNVLSSSRKKILNVFWGTPHTDSFKIFPRTLVFDGATFLPKILLDAFLARKVDIKGWSYTAVRFSERFSGKSNYLLWKKIQLFFTFTPHYGFRPLVIFVAIMLSFIGAATLLPQAIKYLMFVPILFLFLFILLYVKDILVRSQKVKISDSIHDFINL